MIRWFTVASRLRRAGVRPVALLARHLGADEADAAVRPVAERLGHRRAAATEGDLLLPGRRDDVPVVIDERHVRDVGFLNDVRTVSVDLDRDRHGGVDGVWRDEGRGTRDERCGRQEAPLPPPGLLTLARNRTASF